MALKQGREKKELTEEQRAMATLLTEATKEHGEAVRSETLYTRLGQSVFSIPAEPQKKPPER